MLVRSYGHRKVYTNQIASIESNTIPFWSIHSPATTWAVPKQHIMLDIMVRFRWAFGANFADVQDS